MGERAFVQVKSKTTSAELAGYVNKFNELDLYGRMFYVYHSGDANTDDDRVIVVGPEKLAELVLDADDELAYPKSLVRCQGGITLGVFQMKGNNESANQSLLRLLPAREPYHELLPIAFENAV